MSDHPTVDEAVQAIMLALDPIAKAQQSEGVQRYMYRGRDAIVNAAAPLMAKHGVKVIPVAVSDLETGWVESGRKQPERFVSATYTFHVRGPGGDFFTMDVFSETMNSRDKAAGGVLSYAWRFGVEALFCIPTDVPDNEENNQEAGPTNAPGPVERMRPATAEKPITRKAADDLTAMLNSITPDKAKIEAKQAFVEEFKATPAELPRGRHQEALAWIGARVPEPFESEAGQEPSGASEPDSGPDLLQYILGLSEAQLGAVEAHLTALGKWPLEDIPESEHGDVLVLAQDAVADLAAKGSA